jgi:hypothetical protein
MKSFSLPACIAIIAIFTAYGHAGNTCQARVLASIEVSGASLSLADLLSPDSCPAIRRAASGIRLGAAPREGSPRVMEGSQVRARLEELFHKELVDRGSSGNSSREPLLAEVPERISIRHSGSRASCTEIESRILPGDFSQEADCGAVERIPRDAAVELAGKSWDPVLGNWNFVARCAHPSDCVPFLVRAKSSSLPPVINGTSRQDVAAAALDSKLLLRPGQTTPLLWDEDGIRLTAPAVCLDRGAAGETVRARILQSGRIVHAIVLSTGGLRFQS